MTTTTTVTIVIEHPDECDSKIIAARFLGLEYMSPVFDGNLAPETDPYHDKHITNCTVMVDNPEMPCHEVTRGDWEARSAYYYDRYGHFGNRKEL